MGKRIEISPLKKKKNHHKKDSTLEVPYLTRKTEKSVSCIREIDKIAMRERRKSCVEMPLEKGEADSVIVKIEVTPAN